MKRSIVLLSIIAAGLFSASCVKVDNSLGKGLVDKNLIYNTYTEEFTLDQIKMKLSADLSGYSDTISQMYSLNNDGIFIVLL